MLNYCQNWRRRFAIIALAITILLLVGGQTLFRPYLTGKYYIVYWLVCLFFTVLAILFALSEIRLISEQSRKEYKELISKTIVDLDQIVDCGKNKDEKTKSSNSEKN
ncbi:MAG: hypothetical protein ACP5T0_07850 [Verrucomicrobiia bacterium]